MRFDIPYQHRNASGIYAILNLVNCKVYVGSAVNLKRRYNSHLRDIELKTHHSIKIINAVAKHGIVNFSFTLLELCELSVLYKKEQAWIDRFDASNKGYNICSLATSCLGIKKSEAYRKRVSENLTGRPVSEKHKKHLSLLRSKPVLQFDKLGNFITEWKSARAASVVGACETSITSVCRGKRGTAGGFIWRLVTYDPYLIQNNHIDIKSICQYSLSGEFIQKYATVKEAAKITKAVTTQIYKCLRYEATQAGGFLWTFNDKKPDGAKVFLSKRTIYQIDKNGKVVMQYESIREASRCAGIPHQSIFRAVSGVRKTASGFIWRYADAS